MDLLQTTFELDLNDKSQEDQYRLKEPLEVYLCIEIMYVGVDHANTYIHSRYWYLVRVHYCCDL